MSNMHFAGLMDFALNETVGPVIATYYGYGYLWLHLAPVILGLLWLLPLVSSISLFSAQSLQVARVIFWVTAVLTTVVMAGLISLGLWEDNRFYHTDFYILYFVVSPSWLAYFYWWTARRIYGTSPPKHTGFWSSQAFVSSSCVISWFAAAVLMVYLWFIMGY